MATVKALFRCQDCGAECRQWSGHCVQCGAWNSIQEESQIVAKKRQGREGYSGEVRAQIIALKDVELSEHARISAGMEELDRVLGGGLVSGSVTLIGGDPGIGKSTLLLQTVALLSKKLKVLYVTGEESLAQIKMRAERLGLPQADLQLLAHTHVEAILALAKMDLPNIMVVDSIQTVFTDQLSSAPGGVGQVRESAAMLVQFAKQNNVALFLIGHVTKEGALAGPRVLEHMVDTVLYFEGQRDNRLRMIRAIKNRFGAVNELGVFAMTEKGLKEITNPSAIFLSRDCPNVAGSVVMVTWEGSRPLLVEVQALVDASHLGNPRRVTLGLEQNRLAMLLAALHRHAQIATYDQDVFINVVGGVRVLETAADLPLLLAVISSLRDKKLPDDLVVFGEVGLAGEIRPVTSGTERLKEAQKHGFKRAIVPNANVPKKNIEGMTVMGVKTIAEAYERLREVV